MRISGICVIVAMLAACDENNQLSFLQPGAEPVAEDADTPATTTKLVERDVEAPDVFQVTEAGLWDGRPSLGGVWVAHPDVGDPERVIIRNEANGKFVIGALFRREREIPGPRVQTSSDAAAALGMLAGAPVELNVTALRRETVEETPEPEAAEPVRTASLPGDEISASALDPIAAAAAAIEAAEPTAEPAAAPAVTAAVAKPSPKPAPTTFSLDKPYIQIGIFSVEANAKRSADQMRNAGMLPTIRKQSLSGKDYWRVVVGPANNKTERSALLKQIKGTGFSDAYAVTN